LGEYRTAIQYSGQAAEIATQLGLATMKAHGCSTLGTLIRLCMNLLMPSPTFRGHFLSLASFMITITRRNALTTSRGWHYDPISWKRPSSTGARKLQFPA